MTWVLKEFDIGGLSNEKKKLYRSMSTIVYWSMSTKYYQRIDHQNFVGACPPNYIGGLSIKFYWSMTNKLYRRLTKDFSKTKIFCFGNSFFIHGKCMCEGVGKDSRHGAWHVVI